MDSVLSMQCVRILKDLSKASVQCQQDSVDETKSLTFCSKKSNVSGWRDVRVEARTF